MSTVFLKLCGSAPSPCTWNIGSTRHPRSSRSQRWSRIPWISRHKRYYFDTIILHTNTVTATQITVIKLHLMFDELLLPPEQYKQDLGARTYQQDINVSTPLTSEPMGLRAKLHYNKGNYRKIRQLKVLPLGVLKCIEMRSGILHHYWWYCLEVLALCIYSHYLESSNYQKQQPPDH